MHLSAVRRPLTAVLVLLAWSLALGAATGVAAEAPEPAAKGESPADKIRRQLDETAANVEIIDQPLELAAGQLREMTHINFIVDRLTIQQMGIDLNQVTINVRLQNVRWKTALRSVVTQCNLSYAIIGEAVVITSEDVAVTRQMRQRVSVDLDKVPLSSALKQLARETATNLIVDARVAKEAQAPVTLQLEDVPLETAVRLMAEMASLKPVRVGNVLFVTNKANANEIKSDTDLVNPAQPGMRAVEEAPNPPGTALPGVVPAPVFAPRVAPNAPDTEKPANESADKEQKSDNPPPTPRPPAGEEKK